MNKNYKREIKTRERDEICTESEDMKSAKLLGNLANDMHPSAPKEIKPSGIFGISSSNLQSNVSRNRKDLKLTIHEGSIEKLLLDKFNSLSDGAA